MKLTTLKLGLLTFGLFAFTQVNAQDKKKPNPEKMFASIDSNKDGSITLEEMKARKTKKEIPDKAQEKRFAAMDTDANGTVNLEEFKAAIAKAKKKD